MVEGTKVALGYELNAVRVRVQRGGLKEEKVSNELGPSKERSKVTRDTADRVSEFVGGTGFGFVQSPPGFDTQMT
jgi:hypothetical protein